MPPSASELLAHRRSRFLLAFANLTAAGIEVAAAVEHENRQA